MQINRDETRQNFFSHSVATTNFFRRSMAGALLMLVSLIAGCGAGGYISGGIQSLSRTSATIDATQSIAISATATPGLPINWTLSGPACGTANGCGTLTGSGSSITYNAPPAVGVPFQVLVVATVPGTSSTTMATITVNPAPAITANLPTAAVGVAYSATVVVTGGTAPVALTLSAGELPPGLRFNPATGVISGTPTDTGTFNVVFSATDSSYVPLTVNAPEVILVVLQSANAIAIAGTPGSGVVGAPYSAQLSASGGVAPYRWTLSSGSLPAGLTLSATTGLISGTPTTAGKFTFTVSVSDANGTTASATFAVTIVASGSGLSLSTATLPSGTVGVPYSATIGVTGGVAPYTCVITSGALTAGLALAANCNVSGTPSTAGRVTVTVRATDSANPANTTTGPETITIYPASATLALSSPPPGTVGVPFNGSVGVSGGTAPYTCVLVSGSLPSGLTLNANCSITGTTHSAGSFPISVKATDSANPQNSSTGTVTVTINPVLAPITIGGPPTGAVGTPYMGSLQVSGGVPPYMCTLVSGTLPPGLTLNTNCTLTGTPTSAGSFPIVAKATDSGSPQNTATAPVTITINPASATLTISSPPSGTVGTPYTGSVPVSGGTAPYTCVLTGGTLPTGLTLNANCSITGTPNTSGSSPITVKATDSSSPQNSNSGNVTLTIAPATTTITLTSPPMGTVGTPYTGSVGVYGGTPPYTCTLTGGALPAGLTLNANCSISGTPTTAGSTQATITAMDSATPKNSGSGTVTITINAPPPLTLAGTLPNPVLGQPYSQTLHAAGGVPPYTYAITAGALPAGLSLAPSTGVISGTPTMVGASTFTVTATDSETPVHTASLQFTLLVVYPANVNDGELTGPYAFLFQGYDDVVAGVLAYQTATVGSFTADGAGALTAGELDANHQGSTATGNTVATHNLLGTYTIGADNRGSLAITTLNTDGTVGATAVYAIALKAPAAPATVSASGDLIEDDNAHLVGTRGSGTFLAQTSTDFAAGVQGSFAFGLSGDTPCLPACTVGIVAGPAASVGAFTVNAGAVSGSSDANIGTTKIAGASLSGSIGAADSNGRVQLAMMTTGTLNAVYPADYAVYMVNANQAFVLSTDKHSAYILLAGSTHKQAAATFSNASLTSAFVGYENAPTNPGLAGVALQNVLNLSTATIFRGTADGAGNCTTTNVDQGGTTGLVNGLTGLGSGSAIVNALLGTYASLGNSTCAVAASGRAVFNYPAPNTVLTGTLTLLGLPTNPPPARIVYLYDVNQGYFLETGYAGLGKLEQQTGAPFTTASLQGTFLYGTAPAASAASLNASGVFTADGAGHATYTLDENVGVGNVNLIQLGTTGSGNYVLTDAQAGRFVFATTDVIYAIGAGRFVLLDTSALTTSPSIALLQ